MHTIIVIITGLVSLSLFIGVAHLAGGAVGTAKGALVFLPVWLVGSIINMIVGIRGGRSFAEEIPFLVLVFAIPAAAALAVWWKLTRG